MRPTFEAMNMTRSGGELDRPRRRLQTFTIGFSEKAQRYTVTDDRSGQLVGAGYADPDAAERAHSYHDGRRIGAF